MNEDLLLKVLKRLDVLISLQIAPYSWSNATDQERIKFLDRFDLKPSEIAAVLNKSGNQISKQLYAIKVKGDRNGQKR